MKKSINKETLRTKGKTKADMAKEFDISGRTLANYLKDAGMITGRRQKLFPKEIAALYLQYGVPREDVPIKRLIR
ncbi:hypothetical protein [Saccharicrinis aurantiacus]|uniref:hypothetical protein n=1 Tax=Saccharicrinis aurantiacus TaxID=1849719 RepID=UPI0011150F1C|nr:hypothetical protein [Saccharicrinis aurantiacus]